MTKQKSQARIDHKRAAIYVRVSSERQADPDKVSPQAQENDCRELCQREGYTVVEIYRDSERYRVGKRMVEPSGTRSDRPGFKRMLAGADAGQFDILVAWREDRLYRGAGRAMVEVNERVKGKVFDVKLVKEHYDASTATVKAWAGGVELEAKHDRFMMGVAGRLAKGLPWLPQLPYGYAKLDGKIVASESEAPWVRKMWGWWAEGVPGREIRRRLIAAGARQRHGGKHAWALTHLYRMLRTDYYHTGKIAMDWDGKEYLCDIPALVDAGTAALAQERADKWKKHPAGNLKAPALATGLVYCQTCGWKMTMIGRKNNGKLYQYYRCCAANALGQRPAGCCGEVAMGRVDRETWEKLWNLFSDREEFERRLQEHIVTARGQERETIVDVDKLRNKIAGFYIQRQMVITDWRHKEITKADRDFQMAAIQVEQEQAEDELHQASLSLGNRADKLIQAAEIFRAHAMTGFEKINAVADTPERARLQFEARRKLVEAFVTKVMVKPDKAIEVQTEFDIDPEQPIAVGDWPGKVSVQPPYYRFS
jgi:DNA invertase Pin-like site-specific DNA recombinase